MTSLARIISYKHSKNIASKYCQHHKKVRSSKHTDEGVSEVVGTLLLISIGVTLFSVLMLLVFDSSILFESRSLPTSNIIVLYNEPGEIVFENRGGESIPLESMITLNFADIPPIQFTAAQYLDPLPGPNDHYWTMGERIVYNASLIPNLNSLEIQAMIVDSSTDLVIMRGIIREGSKAAIPFVITDVPSAVTSRSEQFNLTYDYQLYYPHSGWLYWVRFSYKKMSDTTWTSTSWYGVSVNPGTYGLLVAGLTPGTSYLMKGEACWGTIPSILPSNYTFGTTKRFDTGTDYVGLWHFEEQAPDNTSIIKDSTINHNNGTLIPLLATIAPARTASGVGSSRAITFDSVNDYANIPDSSSLRTFTNEATLECWVKPLNHRDGRKGVMATNDVSHYCQFLENYSCTDPDVIAISGQYYAIVSRGANGHGYLITVNITSRGQIISPNLTSNIVAVQDFDTSCFLPKIIHISGTVYAIVYCRGGSSADRSNGYLKTLNILPTGKIGTNIGFYSIAVTYFNQPRILPITGSVYAIFYNNGYNNYQLQVLTMNIPLVGNPTKLTTFSFTTVTYDPTVVQVGNSAGMYYYAIAYRDSDSDGYLISVNISSGGLSMFQIDQDPDPSIITYSIMFDSDDCWSPSMIPVANTGRYVVAYTGSVNKYKNYGYVRTFNISTLGIVSNGTYEFSQDYKIIDGSVTPTNWVYSASKIIAVDTDTYVIAYQYSSTTMSYGLVQTIDINATGNITFVAHPVAPPNCGSPTENRRFTFEMSYGCLTPTIIEIQNTTNPYTFAVIYSRAANLSNQGMIKTFNITGAGTIQQPRISEAILGARHLYNPNLFPISGIVYAMVYNTEWNSGLTVTTLRITNTGDVEDAFIDTINLPSAKVLSIKMRQIQTNVYCLAYYDLTAGVVIRTIRIDPSGAINHTSDTIWSYSTAYVSLIDFLKISDDPANDIYAVSFHTTGSFVLTVHISNQGIVTGPIDVFTMTDTGTYSVEYDTCLTRLENSVGGSTDIFVFTYGWKYKDLGNNWFGTGIIITLQINVLNGDITNLPVASSVFCSYCSKVTLTRVYSDVYALAYNDKDSIDHIKTFRISDDGTTITLIDPGPSSASICSQILPINATNIVYAAVVDTGIIRTFRINEKGDISNMTTAVGGYQFYDNSWTISNCKNLQGIKITGTVFAFIYAGLYNDAYIRTLTINAVATKRNILLKSGSYNISADATTVYVAITDSAAVPVTHTVSAALSYTTDWNYIVCMYKIGKPLILYVNANDSAYNGHYKASVELMTTPIASSTKTLVFGGYNAVYDEIGISIRTYSAAEIYTMYHNMI